jgi:hypothetical protein
VAGRRAAGGIGKLVSRGRRWGGAFGSGINGEE